MASVLGYLVTFDGNTMVNHTTKRALDVVDNTSGVNLPVVILPNGTKVYYNGTSDSTTTPGKAKQRVIVTTGADSFYANMIAKLGDYGTLTLDPVDGSANLTCSAVCTSVRDITPILRDRDSMWMEFEFELLTNWS